MSQLVGNTEVRNTGRLKHVRDDASLSEMTDEMLSVIELLLTAEHPMGTDTVDHIRDRNAGFKRLMSRYRRLTMRRTASSELDTQTALQRMDTARWLRRLVHHTMRIAEHSTSEAAETGAGT